MTEFFDTVETIRYEGPECDDPLAFRWYDADRVVGGKTMAEHLRFGVCYWHSFAWDGFDIFGAGTLDRPWHPNNSPDLDPMDAARLKMDAAFEFVSKLGAPFFSFHDIDIAPAGATFAETCRNLDEMVEYAADHMERTGVRLLWGTTNAFSHRRFMSGASTNPDPDLFRYAAAQVAHCMQKTHELGGANYVLWGGREGYETLLNTDMRRELDQMGRFMNMVVQHKYDIGFQGTLLIEPKPMEPTKHQYDYDVATVYAFLQKYGLEDEIKVNIEVNHATLSGHDFHHEVATAVNAGIFGSIDANAGDDRARVGSRPVPRLGRGHVARHARDPPRWWVHDRRADVRHQAAAPIDLPRRPVHRPHRWHGHHGQVAARRAVDHRRRRARPPPSGALRRVGDRRRRAILDGKVTPAGAPRRPARVGPRAPTGRGPPGAARAHRRPPHRHRPLISVRARHRLKS
jgi:xylose isomerase